MADFNIGLLKKHPYATGGVIIVGGLVVFYMLSRQSSSSGTVVQSGGSTTDATIAQAQVAAAIQTNGQQVALQTAQLNASVQNQQTSAAASVANNQTIASLIAALSGNKTQIAVTQSNNDATTLQQMNAEVSQQNIYALQEQQLSHQYDLAAQEQANNNATSLAALINQLNAQGRIASQVIGSATQLATQQQQNFETNVQLLAPTFGKQYNSALDANNANAAILTVLSGGNPGVAYGGVASSATSVQSGNAANVANVGTLTKGISSIVSGLFG